MKALYLFIFLFFTTILFAQQPGTVDVGFGNNGTTVYQDKYPAKAIAIQKDNKLLIGGSDSTYERSQILALTRRNNDGSLDITFGNGGRVLTNVSDLRKNIQYSGGWVDIAVAADNKIVAVGTINWYNPNYPDADNLGDIDIVVARFLPNGKPDGSFGNKGRIVTNLGWMEDVRSIALQADGKILVAGSQIRDIYNNTNGVLLVRYNKDGSLDTTFDNQKGYALYNTGGGRYGSHVLVQPGGNIIIGGTSVGYESFIIIRYKSNGTLDSAVGKNGVTETRFNTSGGFTRMDDMAMDSKMRILATGKVGSSEGVVVTRYLPDGNLDSSFNKNGKAEYYFDGFPYISTSALLMQPQDKVVVSCKVILKGDLNYRMSLVGFNESGELDASFGNKRGRSITDFYVFDVLFTNALMQTDGKIIVLNYKASDSAVYTTNTYLLARFNGYPAQMSVSMLAGNNKISFATDKHINLVPNPVRDYIIINGLSDNNKTTIAITDISGKTMASYNTSGASQYRCDVSKLTAGIYYVQIDSANQTETLKFIKE